MCGAILKVLSNLFHLRATAEVLFEWDICVWDTTHSWFGLKHIDHHIFFLSVGHYKFMNLS
jgi:hypothetical protein